MKRTTAFLYPVGLAICLAAGATPFPSNAASETGSPDLLSVRREAEARAAIAEAERAELLARLPPSSIKPLQGSIDTREFGAAGLAKSFDLARELASEVCAALPADRQTAIYEPAATQGILAARQVLDAIERLRDDLARQNKELQQVIDAHTPQGSAAAIGLALLTAVPTTMKAGADLSALFRTDVSAQGIAYGDGARSLFATLLSHRCPDKVAGLGSGYLGELDGKQYATLLVRVRALAVQRGELAQRVATLDRLAEAAKGEEKRGLAALVSGAGALLKTVDAFIDSLKAGETGDRSPLFNAARYLGYAARTEGMLVLDFDLRLADAVRRISRPVEVDLRGESVSGDFFDSSR